MSWCAQILPALLWDSFWKTPFSLTWFHNLQLGNCGSHGLQELKKTSSRCLKWWAALTAWALLPLQGLDEGRAAWPCDCREPQHRQVLYFCYFAFKMSLKSCWTEHRNLCLSPAAHRILKFLFKPILVWHSAHETGCGWGWGLSWDVRGGSPAPCWAAGPGSALTGDGWAAAHGIPLDSVLHLPLGSWNDRREPVPI